MQSLFIEKKFKYDGSQLRSLYAYLEHGVLGDSVVSWMGPCDVSLTEMVDGEDLRSRSVIRGDHMAHFILEKFDVQLATAVSYQRLMGALTIDILRELSCEKEKIKSLRRKGDDIYLGEAKLNISIATQSPISSLIHFAVNISNKGTPVETLSLGDLQVSPIEFINKFMTSICNEVESIHRATQKVKWVK